MQLTCRKTVYSLYRGEPLFLEGHTVEAIILPRVIVAENEQGRRHILLDRDNPESWEWFQEHFE
jgi:hypothetical protein